MDLLRSARRFGLLSLCLGAVMLAGCASPTPAAAPADRGVQRLYVMYCGEGHIADISPWSPGVDVGKPRIFSDNCYLIRHAKGWMLWDSGFTDDLAKTPEGVAGGRNMRQIRKQTLTAQLDAIGVRPDQIIAVAFSHFHADHIGNAALFKTSTLYIQQTEYDAVFGPDAKKMGYVPDLYEPLRALPAVKLKGDYDVFGDGSVMILSTPGHTIGHQSLLVRLPRTGAVVLSGDAAHFTDNFKNRRVPGFNYSQDQSRASMDKLANVVTEEHAQLWINHDVDQSATQRHSPLFYD